MKSLSVFALTLAAMAAASSARAANEADYVYSYPLSSNAALNGDMFTNTTEILTPRGIMDDPSNGASFQQEPAAGPGEEDVPDETAAMPEISAPTANSTMLSPTTISPSPILPTVSATLPTS